MKSKTEINEFVKYLHKLNPDLDIEINEDGLLIKEQFPEDDTSYLVTFYKRKGGETYRHNLIIYPWDMNDTIKNKFISSALEFLIKVTKI